MLSVTHCRGFFIFAITGFCCQRRAGLYSILQIIAAIRPMLAYFSECDKCFAEYDCLRWQWLTACVMNRGDSLNTYLVTNIHEKYECIILLIRNCSITSSHALGGIAGSRRILLQLAACRRHGHHQVWRHIKISTPSMHAKRFTWRKILSISSPTDLKRRSLAVFFEDGRPNKNN